MNKNMKRLCAIMCSGIFLIGSAGANDSKDLKTQQSANLQKFVDAEQERLKTEIGDRSYFRPEMLCGGSLSKNSKKLIRNKGALDTLASNEKVRQYLQNLDSNSLRKCSKMDKTISNFAYVLSYLPSVIEGIVLAALALWPRLTEQEISKLVHLKIIKSLELENVNNHFDLSLGMLSGALNEHFPQGKGVALKVRKYKDNNEYAVWMCRLLFLAQLKSLFNLLPQEVQVSFDKLNKDENIRGMLKRHWVMLGAGFVVTSLCSAALAAASNSFGQYFHGFSEEAGILADKIDELVRNTLNVEYVEGNDLKFSGIMNRDPKVENVSGSRHLRSKKVNIKGKNCSVRSKNVTRKIM